MTSNPNGKVLGQLPTGVNSPPDKNKAQLLSNSTTILRTTPQEDDATSENLVESCRALDRKEDMMTAQYVHSRNCQRRDFSIVWIGRGLGRAEVSQSLCAHTAHASWCGRTYVHYPRMMWNQPICDVGMSQSTQQKSLYCLAVVHINWSCVSTYSTTCVDYRLKPFRWVEKTLTGSGSDDVMNIAPNVYI